MPQRTLCVRSWDAERPWLHSHAERGNDQTNKIISSVYKDAIASRLTPTGGTRSNCRSEPARDSDLKGLQIVKDVRHVVGVFFFLGKDVFEDAAGGRVLVADVLDDFAVAVDGDALGH